MGDYKSRRPPRRRMRSGGGRGCAALCGQSCGDWRGGLSVRAAPRPAAAVPARARRAALGARRAHRDPYRDRDPHRDPHRDRPPGRYRHRPHRERHRDRPPRYRPPRDRRPRPPRPVPRRHRPHHDEVSVPAAGRRPASRPPPARSLRLQQGAPGAGGAAANPRGGRGTTTTGSYRGCRAGPREHGAGSPPPSPPGGAGFGTPRAGCRLRGGEQRTGHRPPGDRGAAPGRGRSRWGAAHRDPPGSRSGDNSGGAGPPGVGCGGTPRCRMRPGGDRLRGPSSSPGVQRTPPPRGQSLPHLGGTLGQDVTPPDRHVIPLPQPPQGGGSPERPGSHTAPWFPRASLTGSGVSGCPTAPHPVWL